MRYTMENVLPGFRCSTRTLSPRTPSERDQQPRPSRYRAGSSSSDRFDFDLRTQRQRCDRKRRASSIITLIVALVFGALTGMAATSVQGNQPTPWLGVWQRINIAAYMVWIAVLAITLLRSRAPAGPTDGRGTAPATATAA